MMLIVLNEYKECEKMITMLGCVQTKISFSYRVLRRLKKKTFFE